MSHFLGTAIIPIRKQAHGLPDIGRILGKRINGTAFEAALVGGATSRPSFGIVSGGTSTDLVGEGRGRTPLVAETVDGLRRLFETYGGFALLLHFFRGDVRSEIVQVMASKALSWNAFKERFPVIEEDVRYTVTSV
jgi:hypothetical protein